MLDTRFRKIFREITTRKARTALVATSIFIGVFGVVVLFSMANILTSVLEDELRQDQLGMVHVDVNPASETPIDNAPVMAMLEEIDGVTAVMGMAHAPAYWKPSGAADFEEARIFAYSVPYEDMPLEPVQRIEGRFPQEGVGEIAVERRFADKYDLAIGDTIVTRTLGVEDQAESSWEIVGILFQTHKYSLGINVSGFILGNTMLFARYADAQQIAGFSGFELIMARFTDFPTAQAQADAFESTIFSQTPYVTAATVVEDPAENSFIVQMQSTTRVFLMLGVVALVVAGFLVFNVVNAFVLEQRRQIGAMKSLGATGRDNFLMYAGIALVYGIFGVVPGVALGIPAGYLGARALAPLLNIYLGGFTVSPPAILIGGLLGLLTPVLAAAIPVLLGIRVTIIEAMTDLGIKATYQGSGLIGRLIDVLPTSISIRQALRNVALKKGRQTLTIITLATAAGAFMGVFAVLSSMRELESIMINTFGSQISISTPRDHDTVRDILLDEVEGVEAIEPGVSMALDIDGFEPRAISAAPPMLLAYGINPANHDLHNFHLRDGDGWQHDPTREGVIITAAIADDLGKDVGETITIRIGDQSSEQEIIGVSRYPFAVLWMPWQTMATLGGLRGEAPVPNLYATQIELDGEMIEARGVDEAAVPFLTFTEGAFIAPGEIMVSRELAARQSYTVGQQLTVNGTADYSIAGIFTSTLGSGEVVGFWWQELAALEGLSLEGEPRPTSLEILLDDPALSAQEVADRIDDINSVLIDHNIPASYTNVTANDDFIASVMDSGVMALTMAVAVISAVGAIGLLSTLSMSVFERQKEIGVMRSIGATSATIASQFLVEGVVVGVIAWVLGIPLSIWLNDMLEKAFKFDSILAFEYPLTAPLVGLVAMLVVTALASLWPSMAAARKTVSDILRYQ